MRELSQMHKTYSKISRSHKRIGYELGYPAKLEHLAQAIKQNALLTRSIARFAASDAGMDLPTYETGSAGSGGELRDVREALLHFVRDWSQEGKEEKDVIMSPILEALERLEPERARRKDVKVLVPGCGLGRLAWEISQLGRLYFC